MERLYVIHCLLRGSGPVVRGENITTETTFLTTLMLPMPLLPCQVPMIDVVVKMVRGKSPNLSLPPTLSLLNSVPRRRARGGVERLYVIHCQSRVPAAKVTMSRIHPLVKILDILDLNVSDPRLLELDHHHLSAIFPARFSPARVRGGVERLYVIHCQPRACRQVEPLQESGIRQSMPGSVLMMLLGVLPIRSTVSQMSSHISQKRNCHECGI